MRFRFRYSLKFFLLCWLLVGLGLGWFGIHWQSARRQADAVKAIALGSVSYEYEREHYDRTYPKTLDDSSDLEYIDWKHQIRSDLPLNYLPPKIGQSVSLPAVPVPPQPALLIRGLGVDFFQPIISYTFPNHSCGAHLFMEPKLTVGLGKEMDHLTALPHLRQLHLWLAEIDVPQVMESSLLTHLGNFSDLEELTLEELPLTAEHLAPLQNHPKLRQLALTDAEITDEALAALGTLPALEELDLSRCPELGKTGLITIGKWKKLRTIELGETKCDDRIMAALAELPELETLNLSQTSISVKTVRELRKLPRLKRLCLAGVHLTDAELAEVFQGWSNLETLDLSNTNAGELFAAELEGLHGLKYLNLVDTPVSQEHFLSQYDFGDCKIEIGMTNHGPWYGGGGSEGTFGGGGFGSTGFIEEDAKSADETLDPTSDAGSGVF